MWKKRRVLLFSRYKRIRIDAVHYCELEELFQLQRKRKSRHGDMTDIPSLRLQLLSRTLWENNYEAKQVEILKLPYMTRETCKADLARAISVLPNLRYVDLPDGFYTGDPTCHTLRQEMQARCPDIRKTKYDVGAEQYFEQLVQRHWHNLEILELSRLHIEPSVFRRVIASLPVLQDLKLIDMVWLSDAVFQSTPILPDFPPVTKLSLENAPQVTAAGFVTYLSRTETREILSSVSLTKTGVTIPQLHTILSAAPNLLELSIEESISSSLPLEPLPPLASKSLQTLKFEIISGDAVFALHAPAQSYYSYLTMSLMGNNLPSLQSLYVRDPEFADNLVLQPPAPNFANGPPIPRGLRKPLQIYAKSLDEMDWIVTDYAPTDFGGPRGRSGSLSGGRPLSSYGMGLGSQWGGGDRRSVVVGNGFGGFLEIPQDEPERPRSAGGLHGLHLPRPSFSEKHEKRQSKLDLWR